MRALVTNDVADTAVPRGTLVRVPALAAGLPGVLVALLALLLCIVPDVVLASHRLGPILAVTPPRVIGGGTTSFNDPALATKYLILHFTTSTLEGGDRLEVDLGYAVDVFTAASGASFWTRPVGGNTVTIRYIDDGDGVGRVTLDRYGRGELTDVFLLSSPFVGPSTFNQYGVCPANAPPSWENVACVGGGVMHDVAAGAGMLILPDPHPGAPGSVCIATDTMGCLTSCSASAIGPDLLLTAAHCVASELDPDVGPAAFTPDFETACDGTRPPGYAPRFFKVTDVVRSGNARPAWDDRPPLDYAIVQIDPGPGGSGLPTLPLRADAPALGEEVFVVHHPRGASKKVSRRPTDPQCSANRFGTTTFQAACDVDNGSSGSSVFDLSGRIVGVAVTAGGGCPASSVGVTSIAAIQQDISTEPPLPQSVDVMAVVDRSGSMSLTGASGQPRIVEARQATALFVDLLETSAAHRAGLVSFSTTATNDFALSAVTATNKDALAGPAPTRSGGIIGGLTPSGLTSIGDGLQLAQQALAAATPGNSRAVLLMTDGLENTPPLIDTVAPSLAGTRVCAVGFGTEASVDGPRLTRLAHARGGLYTLAHDGLGLKKFFTLCFGNIFRGALSTDPFYVLPADQDVSAPVALDVCGETEITVVVGWERAGAALMIELDTPAGTTLTASTPGVQAGLGDTWAYLRVPLPFGGQANGTWTARVVRDTGPIITVQGGQRAALDPAAGDRFFLSTVVDGGPILRRLDPPLLYTGDGVNPLVDLLRATGGTVGANVTIEIERPTVGTGNLLTASGLDPATTIGGDAVDARASTLLALEAAAGGTLVPSVTESFTLFDDGEHEDGAMETDGRFGRPLEELTTIEGHYGFRARASFTEGCTGSRELSWSAYVAIGIDPSMTGIEGTIVGTLPGGFRDVETTITPRDRYGNYLGPGRGDAFTVTGQPGSTPAGTIVDNGDGSYTQHIAWDPASGNPPGIIVTQPGRDPVVLTPPGLDRALNVTQVRLMGRAGTTTGKVTIRGEFLTMPPADELTAAAGFSIDVSDGLGVPALAHTWPASDCITKPSGTIRCTSADRQDKLRFVSFRRAPTLYRFKIAAQRLAIAPPFQPPVSVTLAYSTTVRRGEISACHATLSAALVCRQP